jgi:phosphopentomutase
MGRRATIVVLDGVGAGNAPDAAEFGDEGANTLANTARAVGGLDCRTCALWGWATSRK